MNDDWISLATRTALMVISIELMLLLTVHLVWKVQHSHGIHEIAKWANSNEFRANK